MDFLDGRVTLHGGDCLEILRTFKPNSVDSIVCDPPYHLQSIVKRFAKTGRTDSTRTKSGPHQRTANGFMNKVWDGGDIAFRKATWKKMLRVLKPGGYIVAFGSSRTFGRMSVAIEDAGFITHPMIGWIFAQGFPKAHRVHAEGWEGWRYGGQALKPALEPIYMGQKPFSEKTGTANVLRWGTGAINVDGCRVPLGDEDESLISGLAGDYDRLDTAERGWGFKRTDREPGLGRWPANVITDGSPEVVEAFPDSAGQQGDLNGQSHGRVSNGIYGDLPAERLAEARGDTGNVTRFFFAAKANADDRVGAAHPTVKPLSLIQNLVRMVTPPNGIVLDPFAGTGVTAEAAWREGLRCILIELEPEYQADIARRMELAAHPSKRAAVAASKNKLQGGEGTPLFGDAP